MHGIKYISLIFIISYIIINYSSSNIIHKKTDTKNGVTNDIELTYMTYNKSLQEIESDIRESLPVAILEEKEITIEPEWINIIATAYTASATECGNRLGITASGTKVSYSRGTIAAPHNVTFGSKLFIPELNSTYIVEDRGNPKYIRWINEDTIRIDIYMKTKVEAKEFGVKKYKGYFIK